MLGPMVYAAAFCEESDEAAMKQMCVAELMCIAAARSMPLKLVVSPSQAQRCRIAPTFCKWPVMLSRRAFADSKTLNEEQREALFADIQGDGRLGYAIESVSAAYISARMLRRYCP